MDKTDTILITILSVLFCGAFLILGYTIAEEKYHIEAVDRGFAHYDVKNDGSTTFKWNK
jgi:hypothetical protein